MQEQKQTLKKCDELTDQEKASGKWRRLSRAERREIQRKQERDRRKELKARIRNAKALARKEEE